MRVTSETAGSEIVKTVWLILDNIITQTGRQNIGNSQKEYRS